MLPPIRRAKLNADTLFAGRATSSAPALWKNVKGKNTPRQPGISKRNLTSAWEQVQLLDLILDNPGITSIELAKITKIPSGRVNNLLQEYRNDGLVFAEILDDRKNIGTWRTNNGREKAMASPPGRKR
jgi:hypothetical protein